MIFIHSILLQVGAILILSNSIQPFKLAQTAQFKATLSFSYQQNGLNITLDGFQIISPCEAVIQGARRSCTVVQPKTIQMIDLGQVGSIQLAFNLVNPQFSRTSTIKLNNKLLQFIFQPQSFSMQITPSSFRVNEAVQAQLKIQTPFLVSREVLLLISAPLAYNKYSPFRLLSQCKLNGQVKTCSVQLKDGFVQLSLLGIFTIPSILSLKQVINPLRIQRTTWTSLIQDPSNYALIFTNNQIVYPAPLQPSIPLLKISTWNNLAGESSQSTLQIQFGSPFQPQRQLILSFNPQFSIIYQGSDAISSLDSSVSVLTFKNFIDQVSFSFIQLSLRITNPYASDSYQIQVQTLVDGFTADKQKLVMLVQPNLLIMQMSASVLIVGSSSIISLRVSAPFDRFDSIIVQTQAQVQQIQFNNVIYPFQLISSSITLRPTAVTQNFNLILKTILPLNLASPFKLFTYTNGKLAAKAQNVLQLIKANLDLQGQGQLVYGQTTAISLHSSTTFPKIVKFTLTPPSYLQQADQIVQASSFSISIRLYYPYSYSSVRQWILKAAYNGLEIGSSQFSFAYPLPAVFQSKVISMKSQQIQIQNQVKIQLLSKFNHPDSSKVNLVTNLLISSFSRLNSPPDQFLLIYLKNPTVPSNYQIKIQIQQEGTLLEYSQMNLPFIPMKMQGTIKISGFYGSKGQLSVSISKFPLSSKTFKIVQKAIKAQSFINMINQTHATVQLFSLFGQVIYYNSTEVIVSAYDQSSLIGQLTVSIDYPCFNSCKSCEGATCTQCLSSNITNRVQLHQGACVQKCPQAFYSLNFKCLKCNSGCLNCNSDGSCLNQCPALCNKCQNKSYCLQCSQGVALQGFCFKECPFGMSNQSGKCQILQNKSNSILFPVLISQAIFFILIIVIRLSNEQLSVSNIMLASLSIGIMVSQVLSLSQGKGLGWLIIAVSVGARVFLGLVWLIIFRFKISLLFFLGVNLIRIQMSSLLDHSFFKRQFSKSQFVTLLKFNIIEGVICLLIQSGLILMLLGQDKEQALFYEIEGIILHLLFIGWMVAGWLKSNKLTFKGSQDIQNFRSQHIYNQQSGQEIDFFIQPKQHFPQIVYDEVEVSKSNQFQSSSQEKSILNFDLAQFPKEEFLDLQCYDFDLFPQHLHQIFQPTKVYPIRQPEQRRNLIQISPVVTYQTCLNQNMNEVSKNDLTSIYKKQNLTLEVFNNQAELNIDSIKFTQQNTSFIHALQPKDKASSAFKNQNQDQLQVSQQLVDKEQQVLIVDKEQQASGQMVDQEQELLSEQKARKKKKKKRVRKSEGWNNELERVYMQRLVNHLQRSRRVN